MDVKESKKNNTDLFKKTERLLYSYKDLVYISSTLPEEKASETREIISIIEACFECIKNEPYADILKYRYIDRLSDEKISEIKYCDPSTITRHRKKLIKRLGNILFPKNLL